MIVGGYVLDLYCDNELNHPNGWYDENYQFPIQYTGRGKNGYGQAMKAATFDGWILHRDGTCTCPICNKKTKTK